jgi:DNA-binding CsgD family transcriptional regulator
MHSKNLLEDLYGPVLNATSIESFRVELLAFAKKLGFDLVMADWLAAPPSKTYVSVNNYPQKWMDTVKEISADIYADEPVLAISNNSSHPVLWDASSYRDAGWNDYADQFQQHGIYAGFDVLARSASGSSLLLGCCRDRSLPLDAMELKRVVSEGQLFAAFALPAFDRLCSNLKQQDFPPLTPKELEVLKWTVAGKTAFEVGVILNSSERTANFHVQNICQKLGVTNKRAAIAKALQLHLIR